MFSISGNWLFLCFSEQFCLSGLKSKVEVTSENLNTHTWNEWHHYKNKPGKESNNLKYIFPYLNLPFFNPKLTCSSHMFFYNHSWSNQSQHTLNKISNCCQITAVIILFMLRNHFTSLNGLLWTEQQLL